VLQFNILASVTASFPAATGAAPSVARRALSASALACALIPPVADSATSLPELCAKVVAAPEHCEIPVPTPWQLSELLASGRFLAANESALCLQRYSSTKEQRVEALHAGGLAARRLGCYKEAQERLDEARTLSAGSNADLSRGLLDLAELDERRKLHDRSLELIDQGVEVAERARSDSLIVRGEVLRSDIAVARGEFAKSEQALQRRLQRIRDPELRADLLSHLGYTQRELGRWDAARQSIEESLLEASRIGNSATRARASARAHNHLGILLQLQAGDAGADRSPQSVDLLRAALQEQQEAARISFQGGLDRAVDLIRVGYALRAKTEVELRLADELPEAATQYRQSAQKSAAAAFEAARASGDLEWMALALKSRAQVAAFSTPEATNLLEQARDIYASISDWASLGRVEMKLAHLPATDPGAGRAHTEAARAAFGKVAYNDEFVTALVELAHLDELDGKLNRAQETCFEAVRVLESMRVRLDTDNQKVAFLAKRRDTYETLISILERTYREGHRGDAGENAFWVSELARGRDLLDLLGGARAAIEAGIPASILLKERELRVRAAESQQVRSDTPAAGVREDGQRGEAARTADEQLASFYRDLQRQFPKYAELRNPRIAAVAEVSSRVIRPGQVLVEYFVGSQNSYVFVLDRNGLAGIRALRVGRAQLAKSVRLLRQPFESIKALARRGQLGDEEVAKALREFDLAEAKRLYEEILAPIAALTAGASELLVIPDGPLNQLPLELLVRKAPSAWISDVIERVSAAAWIDRYRKAQYVLDFAPPISYAISASLLLNRDASANLSDNGIVAFVNPTTQFPQLQSEGRDIAWLSRLGAHAYHGPEASKRRFLADAGRFGTVYVATHGSIDADQPLQSGFWLSADSSTQGTLLTASELFSQTLPVRLLVLRACEGGLGQMDLAEGIMGLSRALKYAGVQNLIVGFWQIHDGSSAELMESFFSHYGDGTDASALFTAKRVLRARNAGALAHPYFWAGLTYWL
jgi:CHAT domain-containing protein